MMRLELRTFWFLVEKPSQTGVSGQKGYVSHEESKCSEFESHQYYDSYKC